MTEATPAPVWTKPTITDVSARPRSDAEFEAALQCELADDRPEPALTRDEIETIVRAGVWWRDTPGDAADPGAHVDIPTARMVDTIDGPRPRVEVRTAYERALTLPERQTEQLRLLARHGLALPEVVDFEPTGAHLRES